MSRFAVPATGIVLSIVAGAVSLHFEHKAARSEFIASAETRHVSLQNAVNARLDMLYSVSPPGDGSRRRVPGGEVFAWQTPSVGSTARPNPARSYAGLSDDGLDALYRIALAESATAVTVLDDLSWFCAVRPLAPGPGRTPAAVVGVFRLDAMVESAISDLTPGSIDVDVAAPDGRHIYTHKARHRTADAPATRIFQPRPEQWRIVRNIDVGNQRWTLRLQPDADYLSLSSVAACWTVFGSGLALTWLTDWALETRRRHSAAALGLAARRLEELKSAREQLEIEISSKRAAEASRLRSEDRFHKSYQNAAVGMVIATHDGSIVLVNPSMCRMTGYTEAELLHRAWFDLLHPSHREESRRAVKSLFEHPIPGYQAERHAVRKDGSELILRISVTRVEADGRAVHLVLICEDITAEVTARRQIEFQASHDRLTGLLNRGSFEAEVDRALETASGRNGGFALMYLDLDGFKFVNDSLGHSVGDSLLPEVSSRLKSILGHRGLLARVGGDEFNILLTGRHGSECGRIAQELLDGLKPHFSVSGYELFVSASIGIARYPDDGRSAAELIRHADAAMYRAKQEGKCRYCYYTPELAAAALLRLELETDLRKAQRHGELEVFYQPLVSAGTGALQRFEALCRWRHPKLGYVAPVKFIPVAEDTGLIVPIGRWMLGSACADAARWNELTGREVAVSVNVSAIELAQANYAGDVRQILRDTGLPPHLLELELTETVVMRNVETAARKLAELRELGVSIALDDFGTGYSSLSYLRKFPIDTLKVDRSFVSEVAETEDAEKMVHMLVVLSHHLGLKVVTEGVETPEQAAVLKSLGCDEFQGLLFGRPMPGCDAIQFVGASGNDLAALASNVRDAYANQTCNFPHLTGRRSGFVFTGRLHPRGDP